MNYHRLEAVPWLPWLSQCVEVGLHSQPGFALISCKAKKQMMFSTCFALRRAQRIEHEASEADEATAACAQGSVLQFPHSRSVPTEARKMRFLKTRSFIKVTRDLSLSGVKRRLATRTQHTAVFVTNPARDWYKRIFETMCF